MVWLVDADGLLHAVGQVPGVRGSSGRVPQLDVARECEEVRERTRPNSVSRKAGASPPATATTQPCAVMDAATACSGPVLLARRAGLLPAQVDPVAVELHPLVAVRACWSRRGDGAEQGRFRPQS